MHNKPRRFSLPVVFASSILCSVPVFAQQAPDSSVTLSAMALPRYDGSKLYHVIPLPEISIAHSPFFVQGLGGGLAIPLNRYLAFGPMASVDLGRKESASTRLAGMGDVDSNLQLGGFLRLHAGPASIGVNFAQSTHAGYGNRTTLTTSYNLLDVGSDRITIATSFRWMNSAAMQTYFGVNIQQASNSGGNLVEYHPSAGLSRGDLRLSWDHRLSYHWSVRGMAGIGSLMGDAVNSPIVERSVNPYAAAGLGYHF